MAAAGADVSLVVDGNPPVGLLIPTTAAQFAADIADAVQQCKVVSINYGLVGHESILVINCGQVTTLQVSPMAHGDGGPRSMSILVVIGEGAETS